MNDHTFLFRCHSCHVLEILELQTHFFPVRPNVANIDIRKTYYNQKPFKHLRSVFNDEGTPGGDSKQRTSQAYEFRFILT